MTAPTRPADAAPDPSADPGRSWSIGRVLVVVVIIALVLFWLWIFTNGPAKRNPDYLGDRSWTEQAETTCQAARDDIDRLPLASESPTATERADVVDRGTDRLVAMLRALRTPLPTGDGDTEVTEQWLADYDIYVGFRRNYADRLRVDPDAQLLLEEKFSDPLDTVLDVFADVNEMPACKVPGDVS